MTNWSVQQTHFVQDDIPTRLNQLSVISYQAGALGDARPALRVRHLLYLGKPQDRSGSPPTHKGALGRGRATTRI
jgi:hypothetical protein